MKPKDIILKIIYNTLKRRKVKYTKWCHYNDRHMKIYLDTARQGKKCSKCQLTVTKPTDLYIDEYTYFWAIEESPLEFRLGFQKKKFSGPLQPLALWYHEVCVDLSDPRSFQKIQEFMTPHLPKLRKKK
jgi:hypothetical protein